MPLLTELGDLLWAFSTKMSPLTGLELARGKPLTCRAGAQRRRKRLGSFLTPDTRLKPGANENELFCCRGGDNSNSFCFNKCRSEDLGAV